MLQNKLQFKVFSFLTLIVISSLASFGQLNPEKYIDNLQKQYPKSRFPDCEEQKREAINRANEGYYEYTVFGLIRFGENYNQKRVDYINLEIERRYGIEKGFGGCVIMNHCYHDEMKNIIETRFGHNFLNNQYELLSNEYDLHLKIDPKVKHKYIDFERYYDSQLLDSNYADTIVEQSIKKMFDYKKIQIELQVNTIWAEVKVDTNGKVSNVSIMTNFGKFDKLDSLASQIQTIQNLPIPRLYGYPVNAKFTIGLIHDTGLGIDLRLSDDVNKALLQGKSTSEILKIKVEKILEPRFRFGPIYTPIDYDAKTK